ncbi:divalent metal [Cyclospora cayetanensis]|uniref:Divalent metal n=1 Tax=Cyclospora cayetanensis TaxID=88456 RepID=A0A1D3D510_9EIME|nr:divalent metal [Cyclospora cayetanensis]
MSGEPHQRESHLPPTARRGLLSVSTTDSSSWGSNCRGKAGSNSCRSSNAMPCSEKTPSKAAGEGSRRSSCASDVPDSSNVAMQLPCSEELSACNSSSTESLSDVDPLEEMAYSDAALVGEATGQETVWRVPLLHGLPEGGFLGPGWLVAMAYLDPGNLEADMQAGAARGSFSAAGSPYAGEEPAQSGYGYSMLWLLLWGHAFGGVFQVLAARLGNVTNADLATLCRKEYGAIACFFLWLATEAAIIGADFQAVIGSALALQVLLGLPMWLGVCLTLVDCLSVLAFKGSGSRGLERVFGCLILVMATCFGVNVCLSRPSLLLLLRGLALPSVPASRQEAASLLSMLGCILMPHGLYLHSALVKSRKVDRHNPEKVMEANYYFGLEAALALTVSFMCDKRCALLCMQTPLLLRLALLQHCLSFLHEAEHSAPACVAPLSESLPFKGRMPC